MRRIAADRQFQQPLAQVGCAVGLARLGGDGFGVIAGRLDGDLEAGARHARAVADKLREADIAMYRAKEAALILEVTDGLLIENWESTLARPQPLADWLDRQLPAPEGLRLAAD